MYRNEKFLHQHRINSERVNVPVKWVGRKYQVKSEQHRISANISRVWIERSAVTYRNEHFLHQHRINSKRVTVGGTYRVK